MAGRKNYSRAEVRHIASRLGVKLTEDEVDQLVVGMHVEQEHQDVTHGDPFATFLIAHAHILENEAYYTYLVEMETHADGGQCVFRGKHGVFALPADHKLGVKVPEGGACCANCGWLDRNGKCSNRGYVNWRRSLGERITIEHVSLPVRADRYCCDLWESGR